MEEYRSYYAIIPANVRYDKELPPNAKLLYGEITALTNEKGYCWASNNYFAKLYGTSPTTISRWIKSLKDKGYIKVEMKYREGTKEIVNRYIQICGEGINKNDNTPINKNVKDNNTKSFNNTSNKKKESKASYDAILETIQNEKLKDAFKEFIKMRKLSKAPLTDYALKLAISKVEKMSKDDEERIAIVNQSVENGWKSFYPLKENGSKNGSNKPRKEIIPDWFDKEKDQKEMDDMEKAENLKRAYKYQKKNNLKDEREATARKYKELTGNEIEKDILKSLTSLIHFYEYASNQEELAKAKKEYLEFTGQEYGQ